MGNARHVPRVLHADTEAQRTHALHIGNATLKLLEHKTSPHVIRRVDVRQTIHVVTATALPRDAREIQPVVHTEVAEGHQTLVINGIPQAQFSGNAAIEVVEHRKAVRALGCRGEAQQLYRLHVLQQRAVAACSCVMELVDNEHIKVRRIDLL